MSKNFTFCALWCVGFFINQAVAQIEIREYYPSDSSRVKERYFIKDSLDPQLEGEYLGFYISGVLRVKGYYKQNQPDSIWTYYYENGNAKMTGLIANGRNSGVWKYFYEDGGINMKGPLHGSSKYGKWEFYYENGMIKAEGYYKNDLRESQWNYYFEDGKVKAKASYENDVGWYKDYYPSGVLKAEGLNKNGKSDGKWSYYYESQALKAIGYYEEGLKSGEWQYFFESGGKSSTGNFKSGEKDGKWTYYHKNGQVSSEGALKNGKKEGYWKLFNKEGIFKGEGVFVKGDGEYLEYYESGKLKVEGYIKNELSHGLWHYYYEEGQIEGICEFNEGSGEFTGYYPDGSVKIKGHINKGQNVGVWELYNADGTLAGYYQPIDESDKPIYELLDMDVNSSEVVAYTKPDYKFKKNKIRYFKPVINEYRGIIIGINPLGFLAYKLPFAIEYYRQERLGYEVILQFVREPFFKNHAEIRANSPFRKGFEVALRQKFYHPEGQLGMFYFSQEVKYFSITHASNIMDSVATNGIRSFQISAGEQKLEYGLTIGTRWMKLYGERWMKDASVSGLTIDLYGGIGIGYRRYNKNYPDFPEYDQVFEDVNKDNLSISPRLGINIGYVF